MLICLRAFLLSIMAVLVAGCYSDDYIHALETPVNEMVMSLDSFYWTDRAEGTIHTASIGEDMFELIRGDLRKSDKVLYRPLDWYMLTQLKPDTGDWQAHHYMFHESKKIHIYTTPHLFRGEVGVAVDKTGRLQTQAPLIQVRGVKAGRRWNMEEGRPFLASDFMFSEDAIDDHWTLRYAGRDLKGNYRFEIVHKRDTPSFSAINQVSVSPAEAANGVNIRRVKVYVINSQADGSINYSFNAMDESEKITWGFQIVYTRR